MTTDEALNLVDQVGASVQMNRQGHYAFQEAIATLRVALGPDETAKPSRDGEEIPEK